MTFFDFQLINMYPNFNFNCTNIIQACVCSAKLNISNYNWYITNKFKIHISFFAGGVKSIYITDKRSLLLSSSPESAFSESGS